MKLIIVGRINYLHIDRKDQMVIEIPPKRDSKINNESSKLIYKILNDNEFIQSFLSPQFIPFFGVQIGRIAYEELVFASSYLYAEVELPIDRFHQGVVLDELERAHSLVSIFLHSYWLIGDNSFGLKNVYGIIQDVNDPQVLKHEGKISFSKTSGMFQTLIVDSAQFNNWQKKFDYFLLWHTTKGDARNPEFNELTLTRIATTGYMEYKNFNRINRACQFLVKARAEALLPFKIAFYIGCLECLFNTNEAEISHQVAERASFYIVTDNDKRYEVFKTIKRAYNVRSEYMHGQIVKNKIPVLQSLSAEMDSILRLIFLKVFKDDYKFFLRKDKDYTKNVKGQSQPVYDYDGLESLLSKLSFGKGDLAK